MRPVSTVYDLPASSEASVEAFNALLSQSFDTEVRPGALVIGEIIRVERDGLLVDVGGKAEGFVGMREIPECSTAEALRNRFQAGERYEFFVLRDLDEREKAPEDLMFPLSIRRVAAVKSWEHLLTLKAENATVDVTVIGLTKGGILVNILELKGFVPASQLRVAKTHQELIGDILPVKILEVDKSKNKLILSHRAAVFEQKAALRAETLSRLVEGEVVEGEIVKVTDFGVFVDIYGIDGLLPLSEISWQRIKHPSELLTLGQRITVRVLTVDQELQRISLTLKRLQVDPWQTVHQVFHVGEVLTGRITKQLNSGVLAELIPGVEAYCAYDGNRQYDMNEHYRFNIVSIAAQDRRITLTYAGEVELDAEAPAEDDLLAV